MSRLKLLRGRSMPFVVLCLFLFTVSASFAQNKTRYTGVVTDPEGSPLAGVSIVAEDAAETATSTDAVGKFSIEVSPGTVLRFTFVGYEPHVQVADPNNLVLNITLKLSGDGLDEVVVTAFGRKQRREAVVGSVTTISAKELKVPSSNLTTAFAGRLAGVIAYQRSGEPGADNATFFVRGVTTFGNGSGNPLILIDNIELTATDLARLQPDDIESFSILKDASATALYGARGANGVIFVTTKQGREGTVKVNLRVENSISTPTRELEISDPITHMQLYSEAQKTRDPLSHLVYSQATIDRTIEGRNAYAYPATDWFGLMFKDRTVNQRANMNLSGGGKVATYYIAGSYNLDNGILKVDPRNNFNSNVRLNSYQLRSNIDIKLSPTTGLGVKMYGIFDDYKGPIDGGTGMYQKALRSSPARFAPFYLPDEANVATQHILFGSYRQGNDYFLNPYAEMLKGYKEYSQSRMLAQFEFSQDLGALVEGLNFRALFSTNRYAYFDVNRAYGPYYYNISVYNKMDDTYTLRWLNDPTGSLGVGGANPYEDIRGLPDFTRNLNTNLYGQANLDYSRVFGERHNIGGALVYTMQQNLATSNSTDVQASLPHRNLGVSGRASYAYDNRYFAEFNFGYNGSERFYRDKQFGFFPTIGVGWMVSNEDFWDNMSNVVSKLKLRASHGLVGNDAIGDAMDRFFYLSSVNLNDAGRGATFGYDAGYFRPGVSVGRYPNNNITWEKSYQSNLALELGLLDKFNLVAEVYRQRRKNILMYRSSIPTSMGLDGGVPQANVGEARSHGLDISLDYTENFSTDLWLVARGSFTYARGVYDRYEEPAYNESYLSRVGQSISQTWGFIAERLFIDEKDVLNSPRQNYGLYQAGDIKYRDINGDGQITDLDLVPIGHPVTPEITYGFGISTGYKAFDLSVFFQGLTRSSFWIDPRATAPFVDYNADGINGGFLGENAMLAAYARSHWSEENRDLYAVWPRLSVTPIENNNQHSTWFMRDGSFLRVKSLELGYTFPGKLLQKYKISMARVYFSGTNVFTFSKFKLWDPEMGGNGLAYPLQKVFNLGVNLSFN